MAEAFGIAGSAFGTVSLGLQLFKEVSLYLDDIDGREEDLKQARNYATNVQLSLNALDIAISNAPTGDAATKNAIESCKASCVSAVNNLLAVVKELRGPTISLPNSNATRAKELCAKLKYPFKKQNIEKLEGILSRTNSALQTILQVIQVNNGHATTSALNNMHQAVAGLSRVSEKNKTALDVIHKMSQVRHDRLGTIQQDVKELLVLTRDSEDTKLLLKKMAQQMSDLTARTSMAASLLQNPASDPFNPSIQTTSYQGGGSMTFNAFCSCKTQRVRYSKRHWGPFFLEAEVRSRDNHAPECPLSKLPATTRRTKRVLSVLIPISQRSWGRASQVSLSLTTGADILGLGQTMAWVATVDWRLSPVFQLVHITACCSSLPHKDMQLLLASCFRRLAWCYANSYASVTDVDEWGDTLLLSTLRMFKPLIDYNADNMAEFFQMLAIIAEPTPCTRRITGIPIPSLLATSYWFSDCTRPSQVATTILSKYSVPLGHHVDDCGLSWHRDEGRVSAGYRLYEAFPQLPEYLEFGPLTQAVLKQDRNEVQRLLERYPSFITESNYCGKSPLHLAIETQNIAIIKVVLHYADTKVLQARDNMGFYPIDYVTKRRWKHTTKESQKACDGCEVLEILFQSDVALFPTSLYLALKPPRYYEFHCCVQAQKIIIKALAELREELKELSYRRLSPAQRRGLEIHQTRILDLNAALVQRQFEAHGCPMPTYLRVYEEDIGSLHDHKSIYSHIYYGEVAEYARQLGFHYSENELADLIRNLAFHMTPGATNATYIIRQRQNFISSSYLCWIIDHSTSMSSRIPARQLPNTEIDVTAAHYLMAILGRWASDNYISVLDCPLSPAAVEILFSDRNVDRCRCWCSPGGCTPMVKLLQGIFWDLELDLDQNSFPQTTEFVLKTLLSANWDRISDLPRIYAAIIRYYTFVELGLRHVCCSIIGKALGPLPEEEIQEIKEEDSSLLGLFESLLAEFECSCRHDMSLDEFFEWIHMNWALRMREVREELDSQRLTDEQLRNAESIGVVWEVYGPQPLEEQPDLSDRRKVDLWDAMERLDQIATDPERPTKESL